MNIQSYEALARGLQSWGEGERRSKDEKLRKEMLKRQITRDAAEDEDRKFDREMKTKGIELSERRDRRERDKMLADNAQGAVDDVQKQIDAIARRDETAARTKLLGAQAAAVAAKPTSPMAGQLAGIDDFADNFASALEENQQAITAMQNPALQQDPAAFQAGQRRALKAQLRLSALQQMSQNWSKTAGKEPMIKVKLPGEDGRSEATMEVPASQWTPQHPLYNKFHGGGGGGPGASAPAAAPAPGGPPPAAIEMLRKNPALAPQFDQKFGAGAAQRYLG